MRRSTKAAACVLIPVLSLLLSFSALPSTAAPMTHEQVMAEVLGRLEYAARTDKGIKSDLSAVRVDLVLATGEKGDYNAVTSWLPLSKLAERCKLKNLRVCRPSQPLLGAGVGALVGKDKDRAEWVDMHVVVWESAAADLCEWQPERLALLIGHELAHITLFTFGPSKWADDLLNLEVSRQDEINCDRKGAEYARAAGYTNLLAADTALFRKLTELAGDAAPIHPSALKWDHPTNTERLEELQGDPQRRQYYRDMLGYDNGVMYLHLADWEAAQYCFETALGSFPQSEEVLTNLAYSELMRYYGALVPLDRAKIGGEVSCLSYVTARLPILGPSTTDRKYLEQGIRHAREALRNRSDYYLASAVLGMGLVMDPEAKSDRLSEAISLLAGVSTAAAQASDADALADATANAALALARLQPATALSALGEAYDRLQAPPQALKLNFGLALAGSTAAAEKQRGRTLLEAYLRENTQGTYYYKLALGGWRQLSPQPNALAPEPRVTVYPARSIRLANGKQVALQQRWSTVREAIGQTRIDAMPVGDVRQCFLYDCPNLGLQFRVTAGLVRAIILTSSAAPPLVFETTRLGQGAKIEARVGADAALLRDVDGERSLKWDDWFSKETPTLVILKQECRWDPLGFAVSCDRQGRAQMIAVIGA